MSLTILQFWDDNCGDCGSFLIDTQLGRERMQEEVEKILKNFELGYNIRWDIDDLIEVMKGKGLIEIIETRQYLVTI